MKGKKVWPTITTIWKSDDPETSAMVAREAARVDAAERIGKATIKERGKLRNLQYRAALGGQAVLIVGGTPVLEGNKKTIATASSALKTCRYFEPPHTSSTLRLFYSQVHAAIAASTGEVGFTGSDYTDVMVDKEGLQSKALVKFA